MSSVVKASASTSLRNTVPIKKSNMGNEGGHRTSGRIGRGEKDKI